MFKLGKAIPIAFLAFLAVNPLDAQTVREWTVMCYFVSDDNKSASLEESQVKNIDELSGLGSGATYDVVVQVDRSNKISDYLRSRYSDPDYSGAKRYHIERNKWSVVEKLGEQNMGDPKTLLDFMTWAAKSYPAKHYLLLVNSHGSGILSWRGPGSVSDTHPGRAPELGLRPYIGYDDTDNDCLTVFELAKSLEAWSTDVNGGRKLDMIAVDACLAGTVEALYQLRDGTDYLVASESLVPGHGFRYSAIIDALARTPAIEAAALGEVITKSFIDRSDSGNVLGAFKTAASEELLRAVDALARELYAAGKEVGKIAIQGLTSFSDDKYWDLERIATAVIEGRSNTGRASNSPAVLASAQRVKSAIKASRVSMWYSGSYAEQKVGGLSILWPNAENYKSYRAFYKALDFAKSSLWDEFLDWRELNMRLPE